MNLDVGTVDADGARHALRHGAAVVLPSPAPLPYAVAATDPQAVNAAKGRPIEQAVALWAHDPGTLAALDNALALDSRTAAVARRLLTDEQVTLLVPLSPAANRPDWLSPASQDGWVLSFGARWTPLLPILADFPILYLSSANRTGQPPVGNAADAVAVFPPATPVLGSTSLTGAGRDPAEPSRRSTTTLRLHPDGQIDLYRNGVHDKAYPSTARYLQHVRAVYQAGER